MADQNSGTSRTDHSARRGSFGALLLGVGLLMVALEAFVAGGYHPGVYVLGSLLVLVGCAERVVESLRRRALEETSPSSIAEKPFERRL